MNIRTKRLLTKNVWESLGNMLHNRTDDEMRFLWYLVVDAKLCYTLKFKK